MTNPISREHVQYALGAVSALHTIFAPAASVSELIVRGAFSLALLGVAGANDFFNSPPVKPT